MLCANHTWLTATNIQFIVVAPKREKAFSFSFSQDIKQTTFVRRQQLVLDISF